MASLHARLARIERASREAAEDLGSPEPERQIATLLLHRHPEMALMRPDQTDPANYRRIQTRLAHARGDHAEALRLERLDPDRPLPPPPGTPWEEQLRLAKEALDRA
jgi:hypothetical protein